jgi:hypothetical protein
VDTERRERPGDGRVVRQLGLIPDPGPDAHKRDDPGIGQANRVANGRDEPGEVGRWLRRAERNRGGTAGVVCT